ncbi:2-polyprenyl-3-methyl-6-methoxy-1,4-benzoquinone monooxygenase [Reinekea sp. G2M2-21]|uniref:2-polyprenyl-3-methyl-6-methoxy-1,4-benzoquinone monooxygenase n=1 Tax=Reinekea sp. G2M2-21 TaxID=2788942 RepID=UPI0018A90C78|nr:2-polyprenyl-3-methyl-6-methoxy-1,4-benzoquinone monooxygenase [Reinekea sp. G2M2-21]
MRRNHSFSDRFVGHLNNALRTLSPGAVTATTPSPANTQTESENLDPAEKQHIARLMRINHTGEVCAQALYKGQALTARLPDVRQAMDQAADEELDHLAWCETRIRELQGRTSLLNPAFYGMSYAMGALAGLVGDKWSLGFVAATEDQVSLHLQNHLEQIQDKDHKSRAILQKMLEDEQRHATNALEAGGVDFPQPVKQVMTLISKAMTKSTYHL